MVVSSRMELYQVFSKRIKPLPTEPQLSDFYLPSEVQSSLVWWQGNLRASLNHIYTKTYVRPWLAKQALWQVHIQSPGKIKHPKYKVTKTNEQDQFD